MDINSLSLKYLVPYQNNFFYIKVHWQPAYYIYLFLQRQLFESNHPKSNRRGEGLQDWYEQFYL